MENELDDNKGQKINSDDNTSLNPKKTQISNSNNFNNSSISKDDLEEKKKSEIKPKMSDNKNENNPSNDLELKPKKEVPIEKKPFDEFVNVYLIPTLVEEFNNRGFEVNLINLKNTYRPIAGDKCWVIYCEIKDICNFWLSFEKEDISSSKSISLSKPKQKPSIIESFLIDEKRITLKLIISRVLQRLNGQKLIGVN